MKLYTTEELVELLQVTDRTIYRYIKQGQLEAVKFGREYRYSEQAVKKFLKTGTEKNYLSK